MFIALRSSRSSYPWMIGGYPFWVAGNPVDVGLALPSSLNGSRILPRRIPTHFSQSPSTCVTQLRRSSRESLVSPESGSTAQFLRFRRVPPVATGVFDRSRRVCWWAPGRVPLPGRPIVTSSGFGEFLRLQPECLTGVGGCGLGRLMSRARHRVMTPGYFSPSATVNRVREPVRRGWRG
jgi:hypothetical protein